MDIPLTCGRCRLKFPSGFGGSITGSIIIEDCTSFCPRCQSEVPVPNGFYHFLHDAILFAQGPAATHETIRAMQGAVIDLDQGRITASAATAEVAKVNAEASNKLVTWLTLGMAAAALLVSVVGEVREWIDRGQSNMTVEDVVEQVFDERFKKWADEWQKTVDPAKELPSGQTASPKAPQREADDTNRKMRRALLSKKRPKPKPSWFR